MIRDIQAEPSPHGTLRLEAFLPYRLNVLGAVVSEALASVYSSRFGIDIPGWRVIATLGQFGKIKAKTIGSHSHMHKTKVSRALAELEKRGLVERLVNPGDRREAIVSLTPQGQAVYQQIIPLAQRFEMRLLDSLGTADQVVLDRLLHTLTEKAGELCEEDQSLSFNPAGVR
jgi:DNA-binding MarR family transcriptional regulator